MKINNIEQNVMYLLGKEWLKSGASGPFNTDWIFNKFSAIPTKYRKGRSTKWPPGDLQAIRRLVSRKIKFDCQHGKGSFLNSKYRL